MFLFDRKHFVPKLIVQVGLHNCGRTTLCSRLLHFSNRAILSARPSRVASLRLGGSSCRRAESKPVATSQPVVAVASSLYRIRSVQQFRCSYPNRNRRQFPTKAPRFAILLS